MATTKLHCKQKGCEELVFPSWSDLRSHQWTKHNFFKNSHKKRASKKLAATPVGTVPTSISLREGIAALEVKRDMMNEVIAELKRML